MTKKIEIYYDGRTWVMIGGDEIYTYEGDYDAEVPMGMISLIGSTMAEVIAK